MYRNVKQFFEMFFFQIDAFKNHEFYSNFWLFQNLIEFLSLFYLADLFHHCLHSGENNN